MTPVDSTKNILPVLFFFFLPPSFNFLNFSHLSSVMTIVLSIVNLTSINY